MVISSVHFDLEFQSPSGVLGVCRTLVEALSEIDGEVSVPFRGFRGLQGRKASVAGE